MKVFITLLFLWSVSAHEVGILQPTQAPATTSSDAPAPAAAAPAAPATPKMIVPKMTINPVIDHCGRCQAAQDYSHPSCGLCSASRTREDIVRPVTMSAMLELEYGRMITPQMMISPVYDRSASKCKRDVVDVRVVHPITVGADGCSSLIEENAAADNHTASNTTTATNSSLVTTHAAAPAANAAPDLPKTSVTPSAVILTGPVPDPNAVLGVPKGTFGWTQCNCASSDPSCGCLAQASVPAYAPRAPEYAGDVSVPLPQVDGETVSPSLVPRHTFKHVSTCCGAILTPGCTKCAATKAVSVGPTVVPINGAEKVATHPDGSATIVLPGNK